MVGCGRVDECQYDNGKCAQTCVDTYNSYYCTCRPGYQLVTNTSNTCPVAVPCLQTRADIVFIVDSSRAICASDATCSNWQSVLNLINSIVSTFTIGSNNIRVGLVLFSNSATNAFFLNSYSNLTSLTSAISSTGYQTQGSNNENLASALNLARTQQFTTTNGDRLGAENIAIVILNGLFGSVSAQLQTELAAMNSAGTTIFSVGMTTRILASQVSSISSIPQRINSNYFISSSFPTLNSVANPLASQVCQFANSDCQRKVVDLVFVLTSSTTLVQDNPNGWTNIVNFVGDLVQSNNVGQFATHIGIVAFADNIQPLLGLNAVYDGNTISQLIRNQPFSNNLGSGQNIQSVLNYVNTQMFYSSDDRADVPNVIVLITNQASTADTTQTVTTAQYYQKIGTGIQAIGASSRVNITELSLIASAPHMQFRQWWTIPDASASAFANIQTNFVNELCRPTYETYCQQTVYGGYQCFCPWGQCDTRPLNGTQCADVNECLTNNGGCQQVCSNRAGSFACSCNSGFSLASDGAFCNDVNECLNPDACQTGTCINSFGAFYCLQTNFYLGGRESSISLTGEESVKIVYETDSLVAAVVVAVSTTVLALVAIGLGIRHFAKMRRDKLEYEVEPLAPEDFPENANSNTTSATGNVVCDVSVNTRSLDS